MRYDILIAGVGGQGTILSSRLLAEAAQLENQFVRKLHSLNFKFRFHDLRHYGATFLHAQGIPDKYIMQRGGWTSISTLQNIYTHCLPTETKIASNAVTKKFNSLNYLINKGKFSVKLRTTYTNY